jgi:hypothetical protein
MPALHRPVREMKNRYGSPILMPVSRIRFMAMAQKL